MRRSADHPRPARRRRARPAARVPARAAWLLLDCGNSRVKWARAHLPLSQGQGFAAAGVIELPALSGTASGTARALRALLRAAAPGTRILACNVAGRDLQRRIQLAARQAGLRAPQFVRTRAATAGVRNGYAETWRLGVDRWVALVGARHELPGVAVCIVGAGSALTVDALRADGRHLGGCIIPGPRMMIDSLLQYTAGIRRRAALPGRAALTRALAAPVSRGRRGRTLFARDTRNALLAGARWACAGLIELAVGEAIRRLGEPPQLILTGGAAGQLGALLRVPYRRQDDLVLRGLAVLAGTTVAGRSPRDRWSVIA